MLGGGRVRDPCKQMELAVTFLMDIGEITAAFKKEGITAVDQFSIEDIQPFGRGLVATSDLVQGPVISVPQSLWITAENTTSLTELKAVFADKNITAITNTSNDLIIAVRILYEKARGADSPHYAYLQSLPTEYGGSPLLWNDEDLALLGEGNLARK